MSGGRVQLAQTFALVRTAALRQGRSGQLSGLVGHDVLRCAAVHPRGGLSNADRRQAEARQREALAKVVPRNQVQRNLPARAGDGRMSTGDPRHAKKGMGGGRFRQFPGGDGSESSASAGQYDTCSAAAMRPPPHKSPTVNPSANPSAFALMPKARADTQAAKREQLILANLNRELRTAREDITELKSSRAETATRSCTSCTFVKEQLQLSQEECRAKDRLFRTLAKNMRKRKRSKSSEEEDAAEDALEAVGKEQAEARQDKKRKLDRLQLEQAKKREAALSAQVSELREAKPKPKPRPKALADKRKEAAKKDAHKGARRAAQAHSVSDSDEFEEEESSESSESEVEQKGRRRGR
jgi:hypothetical protein